jgi:hypothetical protein
MDLFPSLDITGYSWLRSHTDQSTWHRRTLGAESTWILQLREYRQIFIAATLALYSPVSAVIEDDWSYLQYQALRDDVEAQAWLKDTVILEGGPLLDFHELRDKIMHGRREDDPFLTHILVHSKSEDESRSLVQRCEIMLNVEHSIRDGIGARILFGKFLACLAESISKPTKYAWNEDSWKDSGRKLTVPWIEVMNDNQAVSGPEYATHVAKNRVNLSKMVNNLFPPRNFSNSRYQLILLQGTNPGLSLHTATTPPTQETHFITIPLDQSTALLKAIKQYLGPEATITHLGHAAMVLAMLRREPVSNTAPNVEKTLYSPCWLNGRRYLRPFNGHPQPISSYGPLCMSYAPVIFSDLDELSLPVDATRDETREALLKAGKAAAEQYRKIREQKNMLPAMVLLAENMAKEMRQNIREGEKSTSVEPTPMPLTSDPVRLDYVMFCAHSQILTSQLKFFLSDGITEQYISHSCNDPSKEGVKVFDVENVRFAANAKVNL